MARQRTLEATVTVAKASGDLWAQCEPMELLGFCALYGGHYDRAGQLFNDTLELFRRTGDKWAIATSALARNDPGVARQK